MDPMKEIRQFAIKNKPYIKVNGKICASEAFFWFYGKRIFNPWKTPDGNWEIPTWEAYEIYGAEDMDLFCNKAEQYISREIYSNALTIPMLPKEISLKETDIDDSENYPCPWLCSYGYRFDYSGDRKYKGRKVHYATVEVLFVPMKNGKIQYFAEAVSPPYEPQVNGKYLSDVLDVCFDRGAVMDFRLRKSTAELFFDAYGLSDLKLFVVEYGIAITDEKVPMKMMFGKWKENVILYEIEREDLIDTIRKDLDNWDLSRNVMNTSEFFVPYRKFSRREEKLLFPETGKGENNV